MNKLLVQDDYPDIELILGASSLIGDVPEGFRGLLGLSKEFYNEVYSAYERLDAFTIVPVLLKPKSRGRITLRSSNPLHWPILDINYYDNEDDLNTMVQGIKKVRASFICCYINYFGIYIITFSIALLYITILLTLVIT